MHFYKRSEADFVEKNESSQSWLLSFSVLLLSVTLIFERGRYHILRVCQWQWSWQVQFQLHVLHLYL